MSNLLDKVPPHSLEAEQSVLGSMLLEREAIIAGSEHLKPQDFYREIHQKIFEAMLNLSDRGEPVDLVTLSEELRQNNQLELVGGVSYLTQVVDMVPTAANIVTYASIVREKAVLRQLIGVSSQIVSRCYDGGRELDEILDESEKMIFQVANRGDQRGYVVIKDILMETFERIEYLYEHKKGITGVPTGFVDLDNMTAGFQNSDLIIVAARPAMGKTTLALNMAQNVGTRQKLPVAIFSLEMSKEQLVMRMLCSQAGIDAHRLRRGFLTGDDWPKLVRAVGPLAEAPIYIDDTPAISVMEMRAKSRRLMAEHGLSIIFVDYLQLMQSHGRQENRQQEISLISRSLKALAKELNVPIVALSQLSRAVETRNDKRPVLSDLLESGGIEANADLVAFIYRDDYYRQDSQDKNIAEIIVAKQRNGPTGTIRLVFQDSFTRFQNASAEHMQETGT
ncbi:replicative DNA helicase [Candidatus Contubernalis alkaliaceticus]|uniref:replicative DNA helicase n=1 Tax=Candidatus Contubernalis alkaliaceticus TaxID=338645 RepID=UPI001F4BFDC3|nr:replicative DNA helicase [Candidatus Contubernalis alkalaceticus]UNC93708.1 replicative DNA helicase [Candidatus Contubernalis alkalaceticus]